MRGLTVPLKEALIQTAARWPFWWRLSRHSSSTAFERMRRSSASNPVFAALGVDEGRRAGSATKPNSSFASEAANDMLSSFSSSSLPPKRDWAGQAGENMMGKTYLCGESEARGLWDNVSSLSAVHWDPLPFCFFLTGPCKEKNGRVWGAKLLSEKKAIRERREVRLMLSQWEQSDSVSTASAWDLPKQQTHSLWLSSSCRRDLHKPQ